VKDGRSWPDDQYVVKGVRKTIKALLRNGLDELG
jgi:hypothetical protein